MSFQITLSPSKRAAGRYVGRVRRDLQKAFAGRPDLFQADIARELGVGRSVITRQLRGSADMSLARVAEIATVLGFEPTFGLVPLKAEPGQNEPHGTLVMSTEAGPIKPSSYEPPSSGNYVVDLTTGPRVFAGAL